MLSLWCRWRREFSQRLTFMVVPHGTARPRQISFTLPFVAFLFFVWVGLTGWAVTVASQQFDYWRLKAKSHLLRIKLDYFATQLKNSQEMLDEVREVDVQLRALIGMGSRETIIESADRNTGGPTVQDMAILQNLLERRPENISFQDISRQIGALRSEMERRRTSFQEITSTIKEKRQAFRSTPNIWPALGRLTSHFGVRLSPFSGLEESHKGMDIAGPVGTPIQATADGTVQMVGWSGGYGKVIVLDHGPDYSTRYGHNHQVMVKHGDRVKRNQIIALMGATGNATGPHCHYEVWFRGHAVNPRKFVKKLE